MRWQRFREEVGSAIRNQQAFGLSEAFTFIHQEPYGSGDYMYKLSGADDLWLGCWGIIRSFSKGMLPGAAGESLPIPIGDQGIEPLRMASSVTLGDDFMWLPRQNAWCTVNPTLLILSDWFIGWFL
jgi:hypothetical protein